MAETESTTSAGTPLREAVRLVHEARAAQAALVTELGAKKAAYETETLDLLRRVKDAKSVTETAEATLRVLAEAHYRRTQEKAPTPGVTINMRTIYSYDPAKAFAWAQEKRLAVIPEQLDVGAFEKIAKATTLEFVTITEEPAVKIATDLGKVIEQDTSEAKAAAQAAAVAAQLVGEDTPF